MAYRQTRPLYLSSCRTIRSSSTAMRASGLLATTVLAAFGSFFHVQATSLRGLAEGGTYTCTTVGSRTRCPLPDVHAGQPDIRMSLPPPPKFLKSACPFCRLQQELSRRLNEQVLSRPECATAYGAALGSPSFASLGTEQKAQV